MARDREYAARLFLDWLNKRYRRQFSPTDLEGPAWLAEDPAAPTGGQVAVVSERLSEASPAWEQRADELAERLNGARPGSYLLWVPPGGKLPREEPDESEWVRRTVLGASKLASGRSGEVRYPAKMTLVKVRDEGGYANVVGGLGRHWTAITDRVQGTFFVDSSNLYRLARDENERTGLFDQIGLLSQGVETGKPIEFEFDDAWSVQRLPRGPAAAGMEEGWAISGAPEGFDAFDGGVIRRLLRARLTAAKNALEGHRDRVRALVLIGAYDYAENDNAGPSLRGFDPGLAASLDIVVVVTDTEVRPIVLSRGLPWASDAGESPHGPASSP
jgi:hypothetical protein